MYEYQNLSIPSCLLHLAGTEVSAVDGVDHDEPFPPPSPTFPSTPSSPFEERSEYHEHNVHEYKKEIESKYRDIDYN